MSVEQIPEELPKLTPEESAAIDEAIRSLDAGKGIPASEVRQRFRAKWSR
jgi:hypothetical protein